MNPDNYLLVGIASLAAAVIALWRNDILNHNRERAEWKAQIDEAFKRIRHLEDSRVVAAVEHGKEYQAITIKLMEELSNNSKALKEVNRTLRDFAAMKQDETTRVMYAPQSLNGGHSV